jgi:hydrogenase maturation protein HypF
MIMRVHIRVCGAVQGVGFRPFVYRLASTLQLAGWVANTGHGVVIEAEGEKDTLDEFVSRVERERPPHSFIQSLEHLFLDPAGYTGFTIRESIAGRGLTALVLPDIATCPDCRAEIFDPANRRYRYPFTNCTHCGPRFSILHRLPYDRANTSMHSFAMCDACREEYENPADRRFHAQPNACPVCGPRCELWNPSGTLSATHDDAVQEAVQGIHDGMIVAVKGIGGFHLTADAQNEDVLRRLRKRKRREEKPLALMVADCDEARRLCEVSAAEERLLQSSEAPIVLLRRHDQVLGTPPAPSVAPGNPSLGIMLPYSPLHHLLLHALARPIVATSGNVADEPICTDEYEAVNRLDGIADLFLVHNRPIVRHVDDSVARIVLGRELLLRRARGYAPLPIPLGVEGPELIAVGGHLKNTVAISKGSNVFLSQHIGDLETPQALEAFKNTMENVGALYDASPTIVVSDLHPEYLSTKHAQSTGLPLVGVQHHYAHVAACMAENQLTGRVLGVAWDGTGYGTDGTIWGGEFLLADERGFTRAGSFRSFLLPGGDTAIREPRRSALGMLFELLGEGLFERADLAPVAACDRQERALLLQMLQRRVNTPRTSSAGRLFDAVASLLGLRQRSSYEGQAAMELEYVAGNASCEGSYALPIGDGSPFELDWGPMMLGIIDDLARGISPSAVAARFHNALADAIASTAMRCGEERVVLSGGCFQNRILTERAVALLRNRGFRPYWHQRVPPNDGGIALGQAYAVLAGGLRR